MASQKIMKEEKKEGEKIEEKKGWSWNMKGKKEEKNLQDVLAENAFGRDT